VNLSEHQNRRSVAHRYVRVGRLFICAFALLLASVLPSVDAQTTQTRRVLAIRVSFPQETPDDETTSGDGTFDLRTFEEARADYRFAFDTPPHNRSYFSAHLQGLAHYFQKVSSGRLRIEHNVLPAGENDSYILTKPLIEYGNGRTRQEINTRIVELFRDAVAAADAQEAGALDFSDYDDVIVIHAGLGGESSNELNDVPSAFISRADLDTFAEGPIPVDGGAGVVDRGILLPESGGTDGRSGLNGIIARFYANQLGLPRLDNPEDGLPAIGEWSLMDTGNITFGSSARLGLDNLTDDPSDTLLVAYTPSILTAWSRERLGWLTPTIVRHDTTLSIAAIHSTSSHPRAIKVPISADEYFLLENRISRLNVEGRRPTITFSEGNRGVWIANDDYDAFIPGSGVLIWHVDDAVISSSGPGKPVNSNPDFRVHFDGLVGLYRKGLALEEADGLEDIGNTSASRVITSGIISFASVSGGPEDPYFVGGTTLFGPDTAPNSSNNLGYATGIEIEILSPPGEVMDIAVRFTRHQAEWPRRADLSSEIAPTSFNHASRALILNGSTANNSWELLGADVELPEFTSIFTPATGNIVQGPAVDILFVTDQGPAVWSEGSSISIADVGFPTQAQTTSPPVIAAFPGPGLNDVWGRSDGSVVWGVFGPVSGETQGAQSSAIQGIAVGDTNADGNTELIALSSDGHVQSIDQAGSAVSIGAVDQPVGHPVIGNLDSVPGDEIAIVSIDGSVAILGSRSDGISSTLSRPVPGGATSSPVLADIDQDGFGEVLFGGISRIWVTRFNGIGQAGTQFELPTKDRVGPIVASPLIADLDADGDLDVIAATQTGAIYAVSNEGTTLPGFPILASGPITVSPLLEDIDNDGSLELVAFTSTGDAHLWHLESIDPALVGTTVIWGQASGNAGNTNRLTQTSGGSPAAFSELLPPDRAYCYPNPIRGNEAHIRYFLTEAADVSLIIVSAVGQIVDRVTNGQSDPGTDNEIRWDTTDYGSGIYVCRLQATSGNRTETRFIKAAIIR